MLQDPGYLQQQMTKTLWSQRVPPVFAHTCTIASTRAWLLPSLLCEARFHVRLALHKGGMAVARPLCSQLCRYGLVVLEGAIYVCLEEAKQLGLSIISNMTPNERILATQEEQAEALHQIWQDLQANCLQQQGYSHLLHLFPYSLKPFVALNQSWGRISSQSSICT